MSCMDIPLPVVFLLDLANARHQQKIKRRRRKVSGSISFFGRSCRVAAAMGTFGLRSQVLQGSPVWASLPGSGDHSILHFQESALSLCWPYTCA